MSKSNKAADLPRGFLLSEQECEQLEKLRDQLLLMSDFVYVSTMEEESAPLEIRRSMLGQLLESFSMRIDEVLISLERLGQPPRQA
jgi:hypothetical protein